RAVVHQALEIGHAVNRDVVVFLVDVAQGDPRRAIDSERDRGGDAPTLVRLDVASRHVVAVIDCIHPDGDVVADTPVHVGGDAPVIVRPGGGLETRQVFGLRRLRHEVDRPADRTGAVEHRVGAVVDLDLLQVERIGAAVLRAVTHAVDGHVIVGGI